MPVYLNGDCACDSLLAGTRSARSRLMRSKLLGAALPVAPGRVCPAWGCGPAPVTRFTLPKTSVSASASSSSGTSSTPTSTLRSRRSRAQRSGSGSPQYQAYQNWLAAQGANSPSTAYGSTIQSYDASGNPVYSVAPVGQSIIGYDTQGNPIYGGAQSVAAPAPASVTVAPSTSDTSGYQSILDWFTDPTQELISGVQNWILVAAAGAGYVFLTRRSRR